jgi:hypothetical protein
MPFEQVNVSSGESNSTETASGPSAEVYQAQTSTETANAESAPDSTYFVNAGEKPAQESAEDAEATETAEGAKTETHTEDVKRIEQIREQLDKVPEMAREETGIEAPRGTVYFAQSGRVVESVPSNSVTMKEQYKVCERCKGNGRIWLGLRTCPVCKGKGQIVTAREHSVTQSV